MEDKKITLTVAEFRKQVKMALDFCVQGGTIEIERMGQRFLLTSVPRGVGVAISGLKPPAKAKLLPRTEVNPKSHTYSQADLKKRSKNGPR